MNKKWIIVIVLAVVLVGLLVLAGRMDNGASISANDAATTQAPTQAPEQDEVRQPEATTKETIPGVEDSIFDDEGEVIEELVQPETGNTESPKQDVDTKEPTTKPTEPDKKPESTEPTTKPTEPTSKPTEPTTKPTEPADKPNSGNTGMTYDEYQSKSPEEQKEYMDSFEDIDGFFDWYNSAKEEHDAQNPDIEVGDGEINLGEIIGGNG